MGAAFSPPRRAAGGIGLRNTTDRLATLFGDRASLMIHDAVGGGVEAELLLPFTTQHA